MSEDIMVSVICTAYNHEKLVADAIEGVIKQKVDFKIELIIHDDASADGTADVIRKYEKKYPQLISAVYQTENQYSRRDDIYAEILFPMAKGKYIAICEGDDYWIDENKLQKQIGFLEANKDFSMCLHNAIALNYGTGEEHILNTFPSSGEYSQREQVAMGLGTNFPATASYVMRTEIIKTIPEIFLKAAVEDYPWRQYCACRGKVYYFEDVMSVYRVNTPSSYMLNTFANQKAYRNYTLKMIRFYERFDEYTKREFHDILQVKIASDYYGLCCVTAKEEILDAVEEYGLSWERINKFYSLLDESYIDETLKKMAESYDIYIYGTSRLARKCVAQLRHASIPFCGFVVSDNQIKADEFEGEKVFYLSEVTSMTDNYCFILAVQPINRDAIIKMLEEQNIRNYCTPYLEI